MFAGERINVSEHRAVLHVALRMPSDASLVVDGHDVVADVHDVLGRMAAFSERVRGGEWTGATGRRIRTVVNIGIGGSDLGPAMAARALAAYVHPELTARFVSNVDGADIAGDPRRPRPSRTLFVVSSKTFTTIETLTNARTARDWVVGALGEDAVAAHFVAVSTNAEEVAAFGIDTDNMFGFWEWVGGRYSIDSAIGLSLMVLIGADCFGELLAGFHTIDEHFRTTPLAGNVPVLMALIGIWNANVLGLRRRPCCPTPRSSAASRRTSSSSTWSPTASRCASTARRSRLTPDRSCGASRAPTVSTPSTNCCTRAPGSCPSTSSASPTAPPYRHHHDLLVANLIAQTEALAFGRSGPDEPHRDFPGDRPSTTIVARRLTPSVLGQLIALYEHIVFVQGCVWGIDSFDQWGVELGKELANGITPELTGDATGEHDSRRPR